MTLVNISILFAKNVSLSRTSYILIWVFCLYIYIYNIDLKKKKKICVSNYELCYSILELINGEEDIFKYFMALEIVLHRLVC